MIKWKYRNKDQGVGQKAKDVKNHKRLKLTFIAYFTSSSFTSFNSF